ncbi:MAG: pitrilysin family protein [Candidatus Zixiibacteriota bacterium]
MATSPPVAPTTGYRMPNGLEVILKENHSSPMIASIVFVRSGAKYETEFNNGVTHFLEHLLFDGTARRTQEEISDRIKNLGGYINAFTRKEVTAYMSLIPAEYIAEALDIQQDMLFHSIFPEDRFPKERNIVIEEMRKDNDSPDNIVEAFYDRWAYAGSPYARPVIGYENLIATIPRAEVIDYYHTYYQPGNMILLVIGDFDTPAMQTLLEQTYGQHPARQIPPRAAITVPPIVGRTVQRTTADVGETRVDVHLRLPVYSDPAYCPLALWTEILNDRTLSPLQKALVEGKDAPATSVSTALETQAEFSALRISVATDQPANADRIVSAIDETMRRLPQFAITADDIHVLTTRLVVEDVFLREKLHYYAIMKAPMLAVTGYDFMDQLPTRMAQVTPAALQQAAAKHLTGDNSVITIVTPPDTTAARTDAQKPSQRSIYEKRVLGNGLTAIVKSNPDSRVFAVNILGQYRSALEPEGETGISDFVNRMLVSGTPTMSKDQIGRALTAIGAELTTNDNPYIPYDDRYTTPQFTFIKFATIDDYAAKGAALLADLVGHASFPPEEVELTKRQVMGILGMEQGSTGQSCRALFYKTLFGDGPYGHTILGSPQTVGTFTSEDLQQHRGTLYAPANILLTCATNLTPTAAFALLDSTFGRLPAGTPPSISGIPAPTPPTGVVKQHKPMQKEQVYIYMGGPLPGAADPDAAAIMVAAQILSARLGDELREKKGWAYSVGAAVGFDRDFGWYVCTMGTGKANYDSAQAGIVAQIRRLQTEPVSTAELETAQNTLWGSSLTARLSRVNQAYYMGVDEFLGRGYDDSDYMAEHVRQVTVPDVLRVAKNHFSTENHILATVGKLE